MKKLVIFVLLICILIFGCEKTSEDALEKISKEIESAQYCNVDEDCILIDGYCLSQCQGERPTIPINIKESKRIQNLIYGFDCSLTPLIDCMPGERFSIESTCINSKCEIKLNEGVYSSVYPYKIELKKDESKEVSIGFSLKSERPTKPTYLRLSDKSHSLSLKGDIQNCNLFNDGEKVHMAIQKINRQINVGNHDIIYDLNGVFIINLNISAAGDVSSDTCFYKLIVEYGENSDNLNENATLELTVDVVE